MKKISALVLIIMFYTQTIVAASKAEIDAEIRVALEELYKFSPVAEELSKNAKGILIFPNIFKAGFILGAAYGEGALIVDGIKVQYYNNIAGSIGFQLGAEKRSEVYIFLDDKALEEFRNSEGWNGGGDANVSIAIWGVGELVDIQSVKDPVVAFVYSNQGLMYNISLEGSKFSRINMPK